jgi:hypothetical protein
MGLGLWGVHLWLIMIGRVRYRHTATAPYFPGSSIEAGHKVGEVLDHHPELLKTFLTLGFRPLANPVLRKTVARHITIGQACRQVGQEADEVLAALNQARTAEAPGLVSLPMISLEGETR